MENKIQENDNGKTVAILSYITFIGWIIALIMNSNNKTEFGRFHIRQALLLLIGIIIFACIPFVGWAISVVLVILCIIGTISAINGEQKEVPVIGKLAQEWFKGL